MRGFPRVWEGTPARGRAAIAGYPLWKQTRSCPFRTFKKLQFQISPNVGVFHVSPAALPKPVASLGAVPWEGGGGGRRPCGSSLHVSALPQVRGAWPWVSEILVYLMQWIRLDDPSLKIILEETKNPKLTAPPLLSLQAGISELFLAVLGMKWYKALCLASSTWADNADSPNRLLLLVSEGWSLHHLRDSAYQEWGLLHPALQVCIWACTPGYSRISGNKEILEIGS